MNLFERGSGAAYLRKNADDESRLETGTEPQKRDPRVSEAGDAEREECELCPAWTEKVVWGWSMNYYEKKALKTDDELQAESPTLGPEYYRAHALAERVMSQFEAEHFQPIIKKLTDQFTEHLWNIFRDHLVSDTEQNVAGFIANRVERSVKALVKGEKWALERYALTDSYYDGPALRSAIAKHIPEALQLLRLKELEEENTRLTEALDFERRCRS